jgi:hypothetical protein
MSNSYTNILTFILTTIFYYMMLKPTLTYDMLSDAKKYEEYAKNNNMYLAIYLIMVMMIQFGVNASVISSTCGGSIKENIGAAGILTFIPWTLIFGVIIIVLIMYPGFKTAFSDVIGYFYISNAANKVITELLINRDVEKILNSDTDTTQVTTQVTTTPDIPTPVKPNIVGGGKTEKEKLEDAADAIVKICGNTSILINQIVPSNFNEYWQILKPLMKPEYNDDNSDKAKKKKEELFNLVVTRDNIGEAMWYVYTGVLITSIVQLKISTRGCQTSTETMEKNYKDFLDKENAAKAKKAENDDIVYTTTN